MGTRNMPHLPLLITAVHTFLLTSVHTLTPHLEPMPKCAWWVACNLQPDVALFGSVPCPQKQSRHIVHYTFTLSGSVWEPVLTMPPPFTECTQVRGEEEGGCGGVCVACKGECGEELEPGKCARASSGVELPPFAQSALRREGRRRGGWGSVWSMQG